MARPAVRLNGWVELFPLPCRTMGDVAVGTVPGPVFFGVVEGTVLVTTFVLPQPGPATSTSTTIAAARAAPALCCAGRDETRTPTTSNLSQRVIYVPHTIYFDSVEDRPVFLFGNILCIRLRCSQDIRGVNDLAAHQRHGGLVRVLGVGLRLHLEVLEFDLDLLELQLGERILVLGQFLVGVDRLLVCFPVVRLPGAEEVLDRPLRRVAATACYRQQRRYG